MDINSTLSFLFISEFAVIAAGLAIYFYIRLKNLKARTSATPVTDDEKGIYNSLKDHLEQQIKSTLQQIAVNSRGEGNATRRKIIRLLSQRIKFLKLEKDVVDDEVKDQSYWQKICDRLAGIINIKDDKPDIPDEKPHTKAIENIHIEAIDDSAYRRKIIRYQAQIMTLREEFENYRKSTQKLTSKISNPESDVDNDAAIMELMADIKGHDDRLQASLSQLNKDNERLQKQLNDSEKEAYKLDYKLHREKRESAKSDADSISTTAEEEIFRLRDIIDRQYSSIDELKNAVAQGQGDDENTQELSNKFQAVENSQNELRTCIDILEMENQRLTEALELAKQPAQKTPSKDEAENKRTLEELYELRLKTKENKDTIGELSTQLEAKETEFNALNKEFNSLQDEFMQLYEKNQG
jgi:DNA repair exonuclease SbcCD ATPase subunit